MFITTQTYVDIASISVIPITTGGQVNENSLPFLLYFFLAFLFVFFSSFLVMCFLLPYSVASTYYLLRCFTPFQVYYYYPFSALSDPAKLANDLRWNIARPQGFEAVMRVRCSMVSLMFWESYASCSIKQECYHVVICGYCFKKTGHLTEVLWQGLQVQDYFGNFCK